ncbi:hypothetical protein GCM10010361_73060 [Streptomyces olivaceiscleroticus]|uniref:Uncharacterized protein n=1 Tax=Streptomyces olivaceiscleroticus TaxID=68245 RepID=A0ABP3LCD3_9ACTN
MRERIFMVSPMQGYSLTRPGVGRNLRPWLRVGTGVELFLDRQRPGAVPRPGTEPTPIYDRLLAEWRAGTARGAAAGWPHEDTVRGTGQGLGGSGRPGGPPGSRLPAVVTPPARGAAPVPAVAPGRNGAPARAGMPVRAGVPARAAARAPMARRGRVPVAPRPVPTSHPL